MTSIQEKKDLCEKLKKAPQVQVGEKITPFIALNAARRKCGLPLSRRKLRRATTAAFTISSLMTCRCGDAAPAEKCIIPLTPMSAFSPLSAGNSACLLPSTSAPISVRSAFSKMRRPPDWESLLKRFPAGFPVAWFNLARWTIFCVRSSPALTCVTICRPAAHAADSEKPSPPPDFHADPFPYLSSTTI